MLMQRTRAGLMWGAAASALMLASQAVLADTPTRNPNIVNVSTPHSAGMIESGATEDAAAAFVPLAVEPRAAAPALGGSAQWLVVVIQAALAERGCSRLAVNGNWDETTRTAAFSVLSNDAGRTAASLEPTSELLREVRAADGSRCRLLGDERQPSGIVGKAEGGRVTAAPGIVASPRAAREAVAPRARVPAEPTRQAAVRAPRQAATPARQARPVASAARAPRASTPRVASGPAVFVRPVGVGVGF